ncbi:MAG: multidrug transporter [Oscillospiraceae bacterium]|nr:multidrug transporter [Oscillospiraceae bacterium]
MNQTKNKWIVLLTCVLFTFMATLDGTIVNVALPTMAKSLSISSSKIQLVVTSYLITISALIMLFGSLGDIMGKIRVFKFGTALFIVSSLLCGIATSFPMLIVFRVLQAIGAAGAMAVNQGIIAETFPGGERGRALGILGTFVALGSLAGPPLGGFLIDLLSWHYIFLINIPVGVIAMVLALRNLPKEDNTIKGKSIDLLGAALLIGGIVSFFAALEQMESAQVELYGILLPLSISIVIFVAFVYREKKAASPLLHLELFRNKIFTIQIISGMISFAVMYCSNIILPFYLQDAKGYSASLSGMILMTAPLLLLFISPLSGALSDKIGPGMLTSLGLLIVSISLLLMTTFTEYTSMLIIILFIAIMSVGTGLFQSPNTALVMASVDKGQLGIAGSINALARNVGMVLGISLSTTILYNRMSAKAGYQVTDYIAGQEEIFNYGMRCVYIAAAILCIVALILSTINFRKMKKLQQSKA